MDNGLNPVTRFGPDSRGNGPATKFTTGKSLTPGVTSFSTKILHLI
jgi:hypothetical protein